MPIHPLSPLALLVYMSVAITLLLYIQTLYPRAVWKKRVEATGFIQRKSDIPPVLERAGEFEARAAFSKDGSGYTLWMLESAPMQSFWNKVPAGAPFHQSEPFLYLQFHHPVRAPVKTCLLPLMEYESEIDARVSGSASGRLGSVKNRLNVPPLQDPYWIAWASTVERYWNPCPPPQSFWDALDHTFPLSIEFMEDGPRFDVPKPHVGRARDAVLRADTMRDIERIAQALTAPDHAGAST